MTSNPNDLFLGAVLKNGSRNWKVAYPFRYSPFFTDREEALEKLLEYRSQDEIQWEFKEKEEVEELMQNLFSMKGITATQNERYGKDDYLINSHLDRIPFDARQVSGHLGISRKQFYLGDSEGHWDEVPYYHRTIQLGSIRTEVHHRKGYKAVLEGLDENIAYMGLLRDFVSTFDRILGNVYYS